MLLVIKAPSLELAMGNRSVPACEPSPITQMTAAMHRGDEEAYREFFTLYFHRLLAYLLVVTRGNEELARDLVQQTMIKVGKHIRVFNEEEAFWRWLAMLARTAAVDSSRKTDRYFGFLRRFWESRSAPAPTPPGRENAFDEVFTQQFNLLEPEEQSILEKKYLDGFPIKTIAAELHISEKAVESRLTRARSKLKQQLLKNFRHE